MGGKVYLVGLVASSLLLMMWVGSLSNSGNLLQISVTNSLQHFVNFFRDFNTLVDDFIDEGNFWNVVHSSFSFFFLQLQRNTSDGTLLDSGHQVGGETGNLVSHSLGWNDSDFLADLLVGGEVGSEGVVVLLNDDLGSLLDSLSSDLTHFY